MLEVLGILAAIAVCGVMMWVASRIEPHWSSRDGLRFTCVGQQRTPDGEALGRWRELRVVIGEGRWTTIQERSPFRRRTGSPPARWRLLERCRDSRPGKAEFVLEPEISGAGSLVIRMPARSRCAALLDERLANSAATPR